MRAARAVVERAVHGADRAHVRRQHGLRPLRQQVDPGGADRGAPAPAAALARVRRRRPVPGRDRARGDAAAREHAGQGHSGARVETVELLLGCLNRGIVPRVPARGSVGASGDLAPLAHLALPLVGEGEATVDGTAHARRGGARRGRPGAGAAAGEGRALARQRDAVHGAAASLGILRARRLAKAADLACTLSLEALQGSRTSFIPQIHALRPMRGQRDSAANVHRLLEGSAIIEAHRWCSQVQDAYSLRCAPQVHGASRDLLDYVEGVVAIELNAATDNPLVLVDDGILVSNGNFHGQPLAFALDALAMAVAELASISERRVERLVNPSLSGGLPAFLTADGGLNSGFMIPQYVAASLVSENKALCHPASVDSIPTSAGPGGSRVDGERGRPEGVAGARRTREHALAIELLAGAQGVEFLAPLLPGDGRAGDARGGAGAVAAAARRPLARARHRARRRGDLRRLARRCRRGRGRSARVSNGLPACPAATVRGRPAAEASVPRQRDPLRRARRCVLVVVVLLTGGERRQGARDRRVVFFVVATAWTWCAVPRRIAQEQEAGSERRRPSLDAAVEALCGDLSAIRAPRGTELNARSWATEAPLRMLLNNLDPEVAERPEDLVVYGGSGRAARSHDALKAIVRTLLDARRRRDAARAERQAGRRVPHAPAARRAC